MFNNILGNDNIKELLTNAVKNNKASHSYMFVGTEGIGKKLIAKEFAKMILCTDENKYCGKCKSCIEFESSNNPDFKIIEPDGNSLKIEQIREFQNKVSEKPIISNRKVYIINDSDKMTTEAQNGLLKNAQKAKSETIKNQATEAINLKITSIEIDGYAENQKYLALENRLRRFWGQKRYLIQQRKEYHIYKCPGCKQKIRIPRGKGKISIRCPKCGEEFIKNS